VLRNQAWVFVKVVIACVAVTALVSVPVRRVAPGLSLFELAVALACGFVALVVLAVAALSLAQFVLRAGGTDPQWFWFGGEPPGLRSLREQAKVESRES
jgi:hypothetical protein